MRFSEYLRLIKPGEIVLLEHTSLSPYHFMLHAIGETYGWESVLVVDVIDSIIPVVRWAMLSGREIPADVKRIKVGGVSDFGNVILEIDPHKDPGIFMTRFSRYLRELYSSSSGGRPLVTVIMNPERVIPMQNNDPRFILSLTGLAVTFLGNPIRRAFYFVNSDMAYPRYVFLLEELSTRVIRIDDSGKISVVKSPVVEEEDSILLP